MKDTITINGTSIAMPPGVVAYKYADPTEDATWFTSVDNAKEIFDIDPSLVVWPDVTMVIMAMEDEIDSLSDGPVVWSIDHDGEGEALKLIGTYSASHEYEMEPWDDFGGKEILSVVGAEIDRVKAGIDSYTDKWGKEVVAQWVEIDLDKAVSFVLDK